MSESSVFYNRWYTTMAEAGEDAQGMVRDHALLVAPSERAALAQRTRESARWMMYLAETLELRQS